MTAPAATSGRTARGIGIAAMLLVTLVVVFGSRWVLRSDYLLLFDTMQSAASIRHYDVSLQLPHPPGAPVYAAMLRITDTFVGDVQESVLLVAAVGDAVAAALLLLLGIALGSRLFGALLALAWLVSPQAFAGATIGLPFGVDAAASVGVALAALTFLHRPRAVWACVLGLAAAAALGVRYNANWASVALLPLAGFVLFRGTGRTWIAFAGAFVLGIAAWLLPVVLAGGQQAGFIAAAVAFYERYSLAPSPVATLVSGDGQAGLMGMVAAWGTYALAVTKFLGAFVVLLPWGFIPGRVLGGAVTVPRALLWVWIVPVVLLVPAGVHHIEEYAAVSAPALIVIAGRGLLRLAAITVTLLSALRWVAVARVREIGAIHAATHTVVVAALNVCIGVLLVSLDAGESRTVAGRTLTSMRSQLDKSGLAREERAIRLARLLEEEADGTVAIVPNRYDLLTIALYAPQQTAIYFFQDGDGVRMHRVRHHQHVIERVPPDARLVLSEKLSCVYVPRRAAGKRVHHLELPAPRTPAYPDSLVLAGYEVIDLPPDTGVEVVVNGDALELCRTDGPDPATVARAAERPGG